MQSLELYELWSRIEGLSTSCFLWRPHFSSCAIVTSFVSPASHVTSLDPACIIGKLSSLSSVSSTSLQRIIVVKTYYTLTNILTSIYWKRKINHNLILDINSFNTGMPISSIISVNVELERLRASAWAKPKHNVNMNLNNSL